MLVQARVTRLARNACQKPNPTALSFSLPLKRRPFSIKPDDLKPKESQKARSRVERISARLPRFLQGYTTPLTRAPLTHIISFLVLHELTAIVALVGLAATFHYSNWLPPFISEGKWVSEGVEKFGRYFRKKGWLGEENVARRDKWWNLGEGGTRVVVEFATAYAITKALLPLRLILSVWATPWFARIFIVPLSHKFSKIFSKA